MKCTHYFYIGDYSRGRTKSRCRWCGFEKEFITDESFFEDDSLKQKRPLYPKNKLLDILELIDFEIEAR